MTRPRYLTLNERLLAADGKAAQSKSRLEASASSARTVDVAVLSLLFNWPSTGGGIIHTAELCRFLHEAGYRVCHIYAKHEGLAVGQVNGTLPYPSIAIELEAERLSEHHIRERFRSVLQGLQPACSIITDSWNTKVVLAEAASEWPYFIRLAALECLCPLNNVRLRPSRNGSPIQCTRHQLATPLRCRSCVGELRSSSGWLHQQDRDLSGFDREDYPARLGTVFEQAQGVLAVNPLIAAMCEPHCRATYVIPSGFDRLRFENLEAAPPVGPFRFLFAGLPHEYMKGFHVLTAAGEQLFRRRQDFEIRVTASDDQIGLVAPFLKPLGWQSQEALPRQMAQSHVVVVPTVAQEALGRTAVEAMAASRAVIASNIGGLPYTVTNRLTGLLFAPGDAAELAGCMNRLIDDQEYSGWLGQNGREKFLAEFTWEQMIQQRYHPLLTSAGVPYEGGSDF